MERYVDGETCLRQGTKSQKFTRLSKVICLEKVEEASKKNEKYFDLLVKCSVVEKIDFLQNTYYSLNASTTCFNMIYK